MEICTQCASPTNRAVVINGEKVCRECASKLGGALTDRQKALLTACPVCGAAYGSGWSEVDADSICRVTCGSCEHYIEYKVEWVY